METAKAALTSRLRKYLRGELAVAIEAGNQTAWIYELLVELGAKVTVVNTNKVKLIAESRRKTDKIDFKILCELLWLEALPHPVHMPRAAARGLRGLLVARRQLVSARTKLCSVARGMLRQEGTRLPSRALSTQVGWRRLFHAGFRQDHTLLIVQAYHASFIALTKSIQELDRELTQREREEPRAQRLQTMPKVGRIASLTFLAAVDDIHRFPSSRKLVGYSGWRLRYAPVGSGRSMARSVGKAGGRCGPCGCRWRTW